MVDDMQAIDAGDLELERRFESYARARLSPDPGATARIRARVMREARLQHEAARIVAHMAPVTMLTRRSVVRRVAMPLLAAVVWLGIAVGTIAAAHAGGPLYPARLWLENASVPTSGAARVSAELDRLQDRVAEALDAANNGDVDGVAAALAAYSAIATDATAAAAGDPDQIARVEAALANHVAVLTAVAAGLTERGNDVAAGAIETNIQRAIAHNAAVIANLTSRGGGPAAGTDPGGTGAGGGTGQVQGGGTGQGAGGGQGAGADQGAGGGVAPAGNGNGASGGGQGGGNGNGATNGGGQGGPGVQQQPDATPRPTHTPSPDRTPHAKGN
jgi:hypothetical protein